MGNSMVGKGLMVWVIVWVNGIGGKGLGRGGKELIVWVVKG